MDCSIGKDLKRNGEVYFRSGEFSYRYRWDWARWPDYLKDCVVSGVACDSENNVYAFNRTEKWPVAVFDPEGNFVRSFGEGLFIYPHGISAAAGDNFWCADDRRHVVKLLSKTGEVLKTIGTGIPSDSGYDGSVPWPHDLDTIKRAAPPFNRPTRIVESPWGDLYAADGYANAAVHRFSHDLKLIRTWGGRGTEYGKFRLPHGIWADVRERIWVADRENNRVQLFTKDGDFITSFDHMLYPSEIWSNGKHVYVSEAYGGLSIFDLDLNIVAQIGHYMSQLYSHSIGGDKNGNLYLGMIDGKCNLCKLERV